MVQYTHINVKKETASIYQLYSILEMCKKIRVEFIYATKLSLRIRSEMLLIKCLKNFNMFILVLLFDGFTLYRVGACIACGLPW